MASRIADKERKRKLAEQAAAEGSVLRRKAVTDQVSAKPAVRRSKKAAPDADVAESAPVSAPPPSSLSDVLKQSLSAGSTAGLKNAQSSVLDPPPEPIIPSGIASTTTYNPETERHSVEVKSSETVHNNITGAQPSTSVSASTPREQVDAAPAVSTLPAVPVKQSYQYVYDPVTKTRTKQLVSTPATASDQAKAMVPKLSNETQEQYETRVAKFATERQTLLNADATKRAADLAKFTMSEDERVRTQAAMKEREELIAKLGLDPNVKYSAGYLDAIKTRQEDPFTPIVQGLTDVADVAIGHLLPLAGPLAGVMAQAYKSFAPPTSKFYTEGAFENKVVNFLTDNLKDKGKDLVMGQLKGLAGAAKNISQGYRTIGRGGSDLGDRFAGAVGRQGASTRITGGRSFPEGSNIRGTPAGPAPSGPSVGRLPATRRAQAPQRLNVPRNDVIISPRGVAPPAPRT